MIDERRPKHRKTNINIRNVPMDTRDMFKAFCARRGYTMGSAVICLLKKAITEDRPIVGAKRAGK